MGGTSVPFFNMSFTTPVIPNWRNDPGLASAIEYRKSLALRPIVCSDGTRIWFKFYYKKYEHWGHSNTLTGGNPETMDEYYLHTDFIENVSEADYIVRKLRGE